MRRLTIYLVLSILLGLPKTFAIQPIVTVPELPRNLRNFVADERKYFELIVDYYLRAKLLEAQLDTSNVVQAINYDAVQNLDLNELRKMASLAKELYNKVLALPEEKRIINLRQQIDKLLKENLFLKIENDQLKVESNYKSLVDLKDSLILALTKQLIECENDKTKELLNIYEKTQNPPLLSFGVNGTQYFFDKGNLRTYIAPTFDLSLRFLNLASGIVNLDFTTNYTYLTNIVDNTYNDIVLQQKFKDDIWNFQVSIGFDMSKVLNAKSFMWKIGFGAGYFLCYTKEEQVYGFQNDYRGFSVNIHTIIGGFSKKVPIGIVAGGTFFKYLDDLAYDRVFLGKVFVPSIYLGLKFNFINSF
ncbi:hypothetical protein D9V84_07655 [Bacteroidetes/Chlorobi group bacterium Naka2016]|jgi:regulator of replication initiation timing|nr:MAG: hypothetical protein D9V84_07655 [Bacteroidetes/Chlorobi group bacterium Naka2016]